MRLWHIFLVILLVGGTVAGGWYIQGQGYNSPPDNIAVVYGDIYDAETNTLLDFVKVSCGGSNIDYTLGDTNYRIEVDLHTYDWESCLLSADKQGYYLSHYTAPLSDLVETNIDIFLEKR